MTRFLTALLFISLLFSGSPVVAFTQGKSSLFTQLTREEGVKMTLEADFTSLVANKKTNNYYSGTLTTADGKTYRVDIRSRGKFRRRLSEIPPLKLKFAKKPLIAEGLDTLNEIKLVLPYNFTPEAEELVLREYAIYRIYETLTPYSLRARLIRLTLNDTHVGKSYKNFFAILIEHEEELCARLGVSTYDQYGVSPDSLNQEQAALTAVFQYMIGNTDWDISMLRNVRLLRHADGGPIGVIPYDFDFAGAVGAPYATPTLESGLSSTRDRFLMANGIQQEAIHQAIALIRERKKDIFAAARCKYLSRNASQNMINYLSEFFDLIETRKELPVVYRSQGSR